MGGQGGRPSEPEGGPEKRLLGAERGREEEGERSRKRERGAGSGLTLVGVAGLDACEQGFGCCVFVHAGCVQRQGEHGGVIVHVLQGELHHRPAPQTTPVYCLGNQPVYRGLLPV